MLSENFTQVKGKVLPENFTYVKEKYWENINPKSYFVTSKK